jgi:hypothetical protein
MEMVDPGMPEIFLQPDIVKMIPQWTAIVAAQEIEGAKHLSSPISCVGQAESVITINNQKISKVYYRKVFGAKRASNTVSTKWKEPVFGGSSTRI